MPQVPFAIESYRSDSLPVSAQRLVNMYSQNEPPTAKSQVPILGCHGIDDWAECGDGPVRGMEDMGGVLYAVSGERLYSINSGGDETELGSGIDGEGPVRMADNGTQLCIVNGTQGFIYSVADGLEEITDPDFEPANSVDIIASRFAFDRAGTNQFQASDELDGTAIDGLAFASAELSSDKVQSVVRRQDNLVVFGEKTIELMYVEPTLNFPFQRMGGGTVDRGLASPLGFCREDNTLFFFGENRSFYRLDGIVPKRLSTHALEQIWRDYATVVDAHCFPISVDGHLFIYLTFPTEAATFCLDMATGRWHERISYLSNGTSLGRWRGNCHLDCYGFNLVGDAFSGKIGKLSRSTFTEFGYMMRAEATGAPLHADRRMMFFSKFELDIESGVGLTTGQGSAPQIMLTYSDDGGRTFDSVERWVSMGAIGEYQTRVRWDRLGSSRERIYRVAISDPVKRTIIAAFSDHAIGY